MNRTHETTAADATEAVRRENPFSTRFTRPGALRYAFAAGETLARLADRFFALGRRAAIVGPHGSGKSTLLADFVPVLAERGLRIVEHVLHDGCRRLPRGFDAALDADALLVVDGYEQLGRLGRCEADRAVRRSGCGLLVTAHAPPRRTPTLYVTATTKQSARELAARLLGGFAHGPITAADVDRLFAETHGDHRELCFRLYDLYELRRR